MVQYCSEGDADATYTNNEKYTSKDGPRHRSQHCKQRACHRSYQSQSHQKMGNTLLDNGRGFNDRFANFSTLAVMRTYFLETGLIYGE